MRIIKNARFFFSLGFEYLPKIIKIILYLMTYIVQLWTGFRKEAFSNIAGVEYAWRDTKWEGQFKPTNISFFLCKAESKYLFCQDTSFLKQWGLVKDDSEVPIYLLLFFIKYVPLIILIWSNICLDLQLPFWNKWACAFKTTS